MIEPKNPLDAARSGRILGRALNLPDPLNFSTATNSAPTPFNEAAFRDSLALLKATDRIHQEYFITLLCTMGFQVMVMPGFDQAKIILPFQYKEALIAVKKKYEKDKS